MAKLLRKVHWIGVRIGVAVLATALLVPAGDSAATYASTFYTSTFTGYAYGNKDGASGNFIDQGDFANYSSTLCPNDPAASWPFGTTITMVSPSSIPLYDGSGNSSQYLNFTLEDTGDPTCVEPNYWVDIYFGRNATSSEYNNGCPCSGSPSPGYCLLTSHSNCQDAHDFGNPMDEYSGPP
jgi:hypothetical protein